MKPRIYCYFAYGQRSTAALELLGALRQRYHLVAQEREALLDNRVIVIQFANTISEPELIEMTDKRRLLYPRNPLICIGPSIELRTRFELFQLGVEDYIEYYSDDNVVCGRVEAAVSRQKLEPRARVLKVGNLTLDPVKRETRRGDRVIKLRNKEFDLLHFLMERPGRPFSALDILEKVWGYSYQAVSNTVQAHVATLRKKIDRGYSYRLLHTYPKQGYLLTDKPVAEGQKLIAKA